jgi:hypothetical protein
MWCDKSAQRTFRNLQSKNNYKYRIAPTIRGCRSTAVKMNRKWSFWRKASAVTESYDSLTTKAGVKSGPESSVTGGFGKIDQGRCVIIAMMNKYIDQYVWANTWRWWKIMNLFPSYPFGRHLLMAAVVLLGSVLEILKRSTLLCFTKISSNMSINRPSCSYVCCEGED